MAKYLHLAMALVLAIANSVSWAGPANKPPTVSLTAPLNGATFAAPATITLSATAADADGTIARVDFYQGASLIGSDSTAPYSVTWNVAAGGTYTLTATAFDNSNASTTSTAASVTVTGAKLILSSPASGSTIYGGSTLVAGSFFGDSTTRVWVDNGKSTRLATLSGSNFSATLPLYVGSNTLNIAVARIDKTYDLGSVTVTGADYPQIAFTSPGTTAYNAPANITLAVDAVSPAGSISRVDFFRAGTLLSSVAQPPYQYAWNNVATGNYSITAQAVDQLGYMASTSTQINVLGPNVLPTVSLTSPLNGASFQAPANITLTANAADTDGSISMVEFYKDGNLMGATNSLPYSFVLPNVAMGSYSFTAKATDDSGGAVTSAPVSVTVAAAQPPLAITGPVTGSNFTSPALINLTATTSATNVLGVEFYWLHDGTETPLGGANTAPYTYLWANNTSGTYTIIARMTFGDVITGIYTYDAAPITVTVAADPSGETITYLHNDLSGSPIASTDKNGTVIWKEAYQPYGGQVKNQAAAVDNRQFYTGKPFDADTGLSYFGARYYDPVVGRFMGIDPVGFKEDNVHSFNRYAYGNNNPYRFVDPDGRSAISAEVCYGFCAGISAGYNVKSGEFAVAINFGAGVGGGAAVDWRPNENGRAGASDDSKGNGVVVNGYAKASVEVKTPVGGYAEGGKVTGGKDFGTGKNVGGLSRERGLSGPQEAGGKLKVGAVVSGGIEIAGYLNVKEGLQKTSDDIKYNVVAPAMRAMDPTTYMQKGN